MQVTQYDNILSEELYNEVYVYTEKLISEKKTQFTTNIALWGDNIVKSSTPILRYVFSDREEVLFNKIKLELESKTPYKVNFILLYLWTNLSYIPWHNDTHKDAGLTIYLNKNWDKDWGGYFLYEEKNEIKALLPKKNFGVLQEGGVMHSVSTINIGAEYRMTLQTFFNKEKSII